jgi:dTDP-4-dehydrorhamnose reductase
MLKKVLVTGGGGNLAKIIQNGLKDSCYEIYCPTHQELDLLDISSLKRLFSERSFDVVMHCAIVGGRRTKKETADIFYQNVLMFQNLLQFYGKKFKMLINFCSGAIYNRESDIFCRRETDITSVPKDYYGFSKHVIYNLGKDLPFVSNIRIFNLSHQFEEDDRFIKTCINSLKTGSTITIKENKYFDFFFEEDFLKVLQFYLCRKDFDLVKTINLCYSKKYLLSEIAEFIGVKKENIIIESVGSKHYCGDNSILKQLNIIPIEILDETFDKKLSRLL